MSLLATLALGNGTIYSGERTASAKCVLMECNNVPAGKPEVCVSRAAYARSPIADRPNAKLSLVNGCKSNYQSGELGEPKIQGASRFREEDEQPRYSITLSAIMRRLRLAESVEAFLSHSTRGRISVRYFLEVRVHDTALMRILCTRIFANKRKGASKVLGRRISLIHRRATTSKKTKFMHLCVFSLRAAPFLFARRPSRARVPFNPAVDICVNTRIRCRESDYLSDIQELLLYYKHSRICTTLIRRRRFIFDNGDARANI